MDVIILAPCIAAKLALGFVLLLQTRRLYRSQTRPFLARLLALLCLWFALAAFCSILANLNLIEAP